MKDKYPDFLPQWTNALEHIHKDKFFGIVAGSKSANDVKHQALVHFQLDWTTGTCCLTGEAFFHHYAPEECRICTRMTYEESTIAVKSLNNLYEYKIKLAEHLQEDHPSIWTQWNGALIERQ